MRLQHLPHHQRKSLPVPSFFRSRWWFQFLLRYCDSPSWGNDRNLIFFSNIGWLHHQLPLLESIQHLPTKSMFEDDYPLSLFPFRWDMDSFPLEGYPSSPKPRICTDQTRRDVTKQDIRGCRYTWLRKINGCPFWIHVTGIFTCIYHIKSTKCMV